MRLTRRCDGRCPFQHCPGHCAFLECTSESWQHKPTFPWHWSTVFWKVGLNCGRVSGRRRERWRVGKREGRRKRKGEDLRSDIGFKHAS